MRRGVVMNPLGSATLNSLQLERSARALPLGPIGET
jgi:hypothetical protein